MRPAARFTSDSMASDSSEIELLSQKAANLRTMVASEVAIESQANLRKSAVVMLGSRLPPGARPRSALDGRQDALHQGQRRRRTAGHLDIHGNDVGHPAAGGIAFAEDAAAAAAVAHRHHQLGVGGAVV